MRLNTNQYKASYKYVLNLWDGGTEVGMIAIAVGVPVASCILIIQKYRGSSESLDNHLKSIVNFYKYSELVPLEDYTIE